MDTAIASYSECRSVADPWSFDGRDTKARATFALFVRPVSSTVVARRSRRVAPEGGNMATKITRDIIESYLNCKYKGHLKLAGESGTPSDYEVMTTAARQASREQASPQRVSRLPQALPAWPELRGCSRRGRCRRSPRRLRELGIQLRVMPAWPGRGPLIRRKLRRRAPSPRARRSDCVK